MIVVPEVLDVVGGHGGVGDAVVDDGVHGDRDRVSRQDLRRKNTFAFTPIATTTFKLALTSPDYRQIFVDISQPSVLVLVK